jgi:hypothetical protein
MLDAKAARLGGKREMPAKTGEGKKTKQRPYVKDDNRDLRKVVSALRILVRDTVPGTRETVNAWGVPTFESKTPFCFYMVGKYHVTFGFHFGTSLTDPKRLLEGTGKNIRHVKLQDEDAIGQKGLRELVLAASRLEVKQPMRGMSGKRKTG